MYIHTYNTYTQVPKSLPAHLQPRIASSLGKKKKKNMTTATEYGVIVYGTHYTWACVVSKHRVFRTGVVDPNEERTCFALRNDEATE